MRSASQRFAAGRVALRFQSAAARIAPWSAPISATTPDPCMKSLLHSGEAEAPRPGGPREPTEEAPDHQSAPPGREAGRSGPSVGLGQVVQDEAEEPRVGRAEEP